MKSGQGIISGILLGTTIAVGGCGSEKMQDTKSMVIEYVNVALNNNHISLPAGLNTCGIIIHSSREMTLLCIGGTGESFKRFIAIENTDLTGIAIKDIKPVNGNLDLNSGELVTLPPEETQKTCPAPKKGIEI